MRRAEKCNKVFRSLGGTLSDMIPVFVGHETGEITVGAATVLDREVTPEINVTVVASDNAPLDSRRSTSVPVTISLQDVNDNRPIFLTHNRQVHVAAEKFSAEKRTPIIRVCFTLRALLIKKKNSFHNRRVKTKFIMIFRVKIKKMQRSNKISQDLQRSF